MKKLILTVNTDTHQDLRELLRICSLGVPDRRTLEEIEKRQDTWRALFSQIRDKSYLELENAPCP